MKRWVYSIVILTFLTLGYSRFVSSNQYGENLQSYQLSDQELNSITANGCTVWEWIELAIKNVDCALSSGPTSVACLRYFALVLKCFSDDGGGGSTGPPCDPCPNGGYAEEYSTCQQNGGQILGQSQCSLYANQICCQD